MATMFVMCPENVDRLSAIDCSSPISANTDWNTGNEAPRPADTCRPAWAIRTSRPTVFRATVLPPVLGPVTTSAPTGGAMCRSTATGPFRRASSSSGGRAFAGPRAYGGHQQRMSGFRELDPRIAGELRLHAVDETGEARPCLYDVERLGGGQRVPQLEGAPAEGGRQARQNPMDLLAFLLLQGHDVVVDLDGAERLEEQTGSAAGAAVHDAGDGGAMLRPNHQDEPSGSFGHHPFLQVLGRVPPAQVRLERAAQPVALSTQPIPQRAQPGAGVVDHLALGIDGRANGVDLLLERVCGVENGRERRIGSPRGLSERGADAVHRSQEAGQTEELQRLQGPSLHGQRGDRLSQVGRGVETEPGVGFEVGHSLAGGRQRGGDLAGIGFRGAAGDRGGAQRRERQAADRGHDAIEFERLQGSVVHRGFRVRPLRSSG